MRQYCPFFGLAATDVPERPNTLIRPTAQERKAQGAVQCDESEDEDRMPELHDPLLSLLNGLDSPYAASAVGIASPEFLQVRLVSNNSSRGAKQRTVKPQTVQR
jgi:hypothetical protein